MKITVGTYVTFSLAVVFLWAVDEAAGDDADDRSVFVALYPSLLRFATVVRPRTVDAEDLVQEATARTLAKRRLTSLEHPEAYLRRAILNLAMNESKRATRQQVRLSKVTPIETGDVDLYPSDLHELMRLSPRVRAALYLHVVEQMPYEEVAEVLGCRTDAARKLGSRGLTSLRAELREGSMEPQ